MRKKATLFLSVLLLMTLTILPGCNAGDNAGGGREVGFQLNTPNKGEEIAVMTTSMGTIKLRLFPEEAPKAVENFITHAKEKYYDGLTFHRVMKDFMIQGGDPKGNGTGGESIWGKAFEDEFSPNLLNIRGSVAMANSGKNTNGSQFFINQAGKDTFSGWSQYEQLFELYKSSPEAFVQMYGKAIDMDKVTEKVKKLYEENGGNPHLDGAYSTDGTGHTVFAQVFEGMDVVDKIAAVETGENNKPVTDVLIEKIEIVKYGE